MAKQPNFRAKLDVEQAVLQILKASTPTASITLKMMLASLKTTYKVDVRHHILNKALASLEANGRIKRYYRRRSHVRSMGLKGWELTFSLQRGTTDALEKVDPKVLGEPLETAEMTNLGTAVIADLSRAALPFDLQRADASILDDREGPDVQECSDKSDLDDLDMCVVEALDNLCRRDWRRSRSVRWYTAREVKDEVEKEGKRVLSIQETLSLLAFQKNVIRGRKDPQGSGYCACDYPRPRESG